MSNLTPIPVGTAKAYVSNWETIRNNNTAVNGVFQAGYSFDIPVSSLPPSLQGTVGDIHGYLGVTTTVNPGPADLRLILISAEKDLILYNDPAFDAPVFEVSYQHTPPLVENQPTWEKYYEMLNRWNDFYPEWILDMDDAQDGMTQGFIIPMVDIQPEDATITNKFGYFGLKENGVPASRIDMLFYTSAGTFIGIIPKDFTTPVPPFPNGKTGWGLF